MAVVAAKSRERYKEMIMAMKEANLEPVIIEDLVRIGIDQGIEQGIEQGRLQMARHMLFETLDARGLSIEADHRRRIEAECSIERLTELLRRAICASSVDDVLV